MPVINIDPNKGFDGGVASTGRAYGIAIEFVVYIGVCAGIGWLVDRYVVGSAQTWTIVGLAFGLIGATIRIMKAVGKMTSGPKKPGPPAGGGAVGESRASDAGEPR